MDPDPEPPVYDTLNEADSFDYDMENTDRDIPRKPTHCNSLTLDNVNTEPLLHHHRPKKDLQSNFFFKDIYASILSDEKIFAGKRRVSKNSNNCTIIKEHHKPNSKHINFETVSDFAVSGPKSDNISQSSRKSSLLQRTFSKLKEDSLRTGIFCMVSSSLGAGVLALPKAFAIWGILGGSIVETLSAINSLISLKIMCILSAKVLFYL